MRESIIIWRGITRPVLTNLRRRILNPHCHLLCTWMYYVLNVDKCGKVVRSVFIQQLSELTCQSFCFSLVLSCILPFSPTFLLYIFSSKSVFLTCTKKKASNICWHDRQVCLILLHSPQVKQVAVFRTLAITSSDKMSFSQSVINPPRKQEAEEEEIWRCVCMWQGWSVAASYLYNASLFAAFQFQSDYNHLIVATYLM